MRSMEINHNLGRARLVTTPPLVKLRFNGLYRLEEESDEMVV